MSLQAEGTYCKSLLLEGTRQPAKGLLYRPIPSIDGLSFNAVDYNQRTETNGSIDIKINGKPSPSALSKSTEKDLTPLACSVSAAAHRTAATSSSA